MLAAEGTTHARYRAPADNNTALVVPRLDSLRPTPPCPDFGLDFGGQTLADLRATARHELLAAARAYTSGYRDLPPLPDGPAPLYLTGHQAELFHPGVWFKNFMLSRLAAEHRAVGVHLVIDTDLFRTSSLRVPTGSPRTPRLEAVPMDAMAPAIPIEAHRVIDRALLGSFGRRVAETIEPLVAEPMIESLWPEVLAATERTGGVLGLALAQARHRLEARWSAATLEVPMSHCCELPSFRLFAATLLADAPRVRQAYNKSLASYRAAHRLRNSAQPMPDLAADEQWIETPFWIWREGEPRRRPLYALPGDGRLQLTNRDDWHTTLALSADAAPADLAPQLADLASEGVRIRTRALTTTLFARLVLGDLFLHGIGGAKYDEVTDELSRRLWGCPPPPYVALSATFELPIEHRSVGPQDVTELEQTLRELRYHPERYLPADADEAALRAVAEKARWIATPKTPDGAAERHRRIEAANAAMQPAVEHLRRRVTARLDKYRSLARASAVLESREYAFCLFPEADLRQRMWHVVESL